MIDTSTDYKTQIDATETTVTMRVTIDYSDYNIDNSITSTVTKTDRLSDDDQMADGIETPTYEWQSWGNFEWGRHLRSETSTQNEKGALSEQLSEDDNNFKQRISKIAGGAVAGGVVAATYTDYPKFRINFSPRTVNSLKAVFDDKLQEYAVDFDVNVYSDDYSTPDHTENVTNYTSVKWETDITAVANATAVEIIVYEWSHPNVKAKIIESFTSLQQEYTTAEIERVNVYEEKTAQGAESPISNITSNTCAISLINIDSEFDNDNQLSALANNITKNRRITPYFKLNDLTDDEIKLGEFYSKEWSVNNNEMSAEVTGEDLFSLMADQEYTDSQWITPGSDQNFTYTTTADFDGFTKDNTTSTNNELQFGGAALLCSGSGFGTNISGGAVVPFLSSGSTYCGTADKLISFTYVPGTSVTVTVSYNATIPTGANITLFADYNGTYEQFENTITFTPIDLTDTTQEFTLRIFMTTQSTISALAVQNISVTISSAVTLYALAAKVLEDFDSATNLIQGDYQISQELAETKIPNAFFKPQPYKEALRKICEAGGAIAYQRRDGFIIIETFSEIGTASKTYTDSNCFEIKKTTRSNTIFNRATVIINEYIQATSVEEVGNVEISIDDNDVLEFTIEFDKIPCDTITYSGLPSGVTISDSVEYTWGVEIEVTNASGSDQEFNLVVNAKPYEISGNKKYTLDNTESIRKNSVVELVINNELVQTEAQAQVIAEELINNYSEQQKDVEIQATPDPSIELGDTITVNGNFYVVEKTELDYNTGELNEIIGGRR